MSAIILPAAQRPLTKMEQMSICVMVRNDTFTTVKLTSSHTFSDAEGRALLEEVLVGAGVQTVGRRELIEDAAKSYIRSRITRERNTLEHGVQVVVVNAEMDNNPFREEGWLDLTEELRGSLYETASPRVKVLWEFSLIHLMPKVSRKWNSALRLRGIGREGLSLAYDGITISDEAILLLVLEFKMARWLLAQDNAAENAGDVVVRRLSGRQANRVELTSPAGLARYAAIFDRVHRQRSVASAASWKIAAVNAAVEAVATRNDNRAPTQRTRSRDVNPRVRLPRG